MGLFHWIKFWTAAIKDVILLLIFTCYVFLELGFRRFFPVKQKSLSNEVILITGAANGVGRELCMQLVDSGAKLICWDISKRENSSLAQELKDLGADAVHYEVDISDLGQVQKAVEQIKCKFGSVSMLINNASIMPCHEFLSHNPREVSRAFHVNVYGLLWILREVLPDMIQNKRGHIVCMCSIAGVLGARNLVAYSGSKHAANGIIESLKDELRFHPDKPDIKFTTVYSTPAVTSFSKNVIHSRFPWILPIMMDPYFIAEQSIEGITKNAEYIYIPSVYNFLIHLIKPLPPKVFKAIRDLMGIYTEPRENLKILGKRPLSEGYQ